MIYHTGQCERTHFTMKGGCANSRSMEIDETFRKNLIDMRAAKGMDAKALSRAAGLGERGVKDIEECRSQSPKISTAYKLAKALDADLIEMMGLGTVPNVSPKVVDFLLQYDEGEQEQLLAALSLIPPRPAE